jgi:hypothetical protein
MSNENSISESMYEIYVQPENLDSEYDSYIKNFKDEHLSAMHSLSNPVTIPELEDAAYLKIGQIYIEVAKCKNQLLQARIALSTASKIWKLERGLIEWLKRDTDLYAQMRDDIQQFFTIVYHNSRLKCNAERRLKYAISRLSIRELNY